MSNAIVTPVSIDVAMQVSSHPQSHLMTVIFSFYRIAIIMECGSGDIAVAVIIVVVISGRSVAVAIAYGDVATVVGNTGRATSNLVDIVDVGVVIISGRSTGVRVVALLQPLMLQDES